MKYKEKWINMKSPKISVIMPAYNTEKYIAEAIESILTQTFPDFEFIIINDGSTDNTAQIIKKYADKDHRIKFINHKKNTKTAGFRNDGLDAATSENVFQTIKPELSLVRSAELSDTSRFNDVLFQSGPAYTNRDAFFADYRKEDKIIPIIQKHLVKRDVGAAKIDKTAFLRFFCWISNTCASSKIWRAKLYPVYKFSNFLEQKCQNLPDIFGCLF